MKDQLDQPTRT